MKLRARAIAASLLLGCQATPTPATADHAASRPPMRMLASEAPRLGPPGRSTGLQRRLAVTELDSAPAEAAPLTGTVTSDGADIDLAPASQTRAVVLLYHAFDVGRQPLSIGSQTFERQLTWLRSNGVQVVPLSDLIAFIRGERLLPHKVAVITIDDAVASVYSRAWPVLERTRTPFTLGLPTRAVGNRPNTMTWAQVRELVASGLCELASHGHAHRNLAAVGSDLAREELILSREIITRETGVAPSAYFYPVGAADERSEQRVFDAGYLAAFTATGSALALGSHRATRLPRTTVFYGDGDHRLAYYFGAFLKQLPVKAGVSR